MSNTVLKVENISKLYRLGEVGTGTISHDLNRWWAKLRGKDDPYAIVGQENDRSKRAKSDYVWSLKDIDFEVKQGDVLGIIGKNGAGKSTLLKIISQITSPTSGSIKAKGRIAALLEVGTGMHPEMTARENIYLNGALLGMRKREIDAKFDEIVDFSGCALYVDTPVKRFSSGMRVRLGFAVAAFLEPEILIVDEVLAVGDAEFQKKAIGKMQDVSKSEGRTVLFVSHNMAAVQHLCTRGIILEHGKISFDGDVEKTIRKYLETNSDSLELIPENRKGSGIIKLNKVSVYSKEEGVLPQSGESFYMKFYLSNPQNILSQHIRFDLRIDDSFGQSLAWLSNKMQPLIHNVVTNQLIFKMDKLQLNHGKYYVTIYIAINNQVSDWIQNAFSFEVSQGDFYSNGKYISTVQSKILLEYKIIYDDK